MVPLDGRAGFELRHPGGLAQAWAFPMSTTMISPAAGQGTEIVSDVTRPHPSQRSGPGEGEVADHGVTADRRRLAGVIDPKSAVDDLPELTDPLVVVAFEGWNDAGDAATGAVEHLELIWDAKPLAALDPEDYYDFQVNRPTVSLIGGREPPDRVADDPHLGRPAAGQRARRRAHPRHRAEHALARVLRRADRDPQELDVSIVVALGALLADTPHTRPTPVTGSAYDAESARTYGLETSRYEGPTGILGVFQDACVQAGLPAISFWAAVPHYVSQPPSPRATVALLQRVEEVLELPVPLGALPQQAEDWVKTVDEMANEDDEVVEYVRVARGAGHRDRPLAGQRRPDRPRVRALPPPPRRSGGCAASRGAPEAVSVAAWRRAPSRRPRRRHSAAVRRGGRRSNGVIRDVASASKRRSCMFSANRSVIPDT